MDVDQERPRARHLHPLAAPAAAAAEPQPRGARAAEDAHEHEGAGGGRYGGGQRRGLNPLERACLGQHRQRPGISLVGARSALSRLGHRASVPGLRADQLSLVHAVALDDAATHRLHATVHGRVGLEYPAHLAALLPRRGGHPEVLGVQAGGHAGVLGGRQYPQEAHAHAVDELPLAQEAPPAERQQPAVHARERLVHVGHRDRHSHRLPVPLGDHEPVAVEDQLQLLGVVVEVLLRVGNEAPILAPGLVVDPGEGVELLPQPPAAHLADGDPVLWLELVRQLPDHRQHLVTLGHVQLPHVEVHRLRQPGRLAQLAVVGRMPGLLYHRLALVALDQHPGLVVHREVHRPDHSVAATRAQPALGRLQQRVERLVVPFELEEAEHAPSAPVEIVEGVVDLGAQPAHHAALAAGQEQLGLGVLEVGVEARTQEQPALQAQRWNPLRGGRVQPEGQLHELPPVASSADGSDLQRHGAAPYMPTAIDLFEKARKHERLEQLQAARERDLLPYFRLLEGPAGPVVEMEGRERLMLGGNNYLGLTGDERVKQAAREALDRYGTGVTGSRFMNGTMPIHLRLERELAEWMGSDDTLVYSAGYLANVGCIATLLGPGDTVICDAGDHASILDAVSMSRARIRPFRHNRLDKLEKMLERSESDGGGVLVVVDGVFSMEGDLAPLPDIVTLCREHGARVMVDEAHGVGVLGATGAGACELFGVESEVDL